MAAGDSPTIVAHFRREQPVGPQAATSSCASELARHTAILGSVAAALSNPVKAKHYYLALDGAGGLMRYPLCQELRGEARVLSAAWEKSSQMRDRGIHSRWDSRNQAPDHLRDRDRTRVTESCEAGTTGARARCSVASRRGVAV